jgi:hypothetical protein
MSADSCGSVHKENILYELADTFQYCILAKKNKYSYKISKPYKQEAFAKQQLCSKYHRHGN